MKKCTTPFSGAPPGFLGIFATLCLSVSVACERPRVHQPAAPLHSPTVAAAVAAEFASWIHDGCFLCLRNVVRRYRSLPSDLQSSPRVTSVAAKASVLLILRHKELGIPPDSDYAMAERLVASGMDQSLASETLRQVAQTAAWNANGVGPDFIERQQQRWPTLEERQRWPTQMSWADDETSAYTFIFFVCQYGLPASATIDDVHGRFSSSPLVTYAWSACTHNRAALQSLLEANPRFYEIDFLVGRLLDAERRPDEADEAFRRAWAAIPEFTAPALAAAKISINGYDYRAALELVNAVLAQVPDHRAALLSKVVALSGLGHHDEAASIARRLVDLGRWWLGDAYYWLAWNEYYLGDHIRSRDHVEQAKDYEQTGRVFLLAGVLETVGSRWQAAEREFAKALEANPDLCEARDDIAQVTVRLNRASEAAGGFVEAASCFDARRQDLELQINALTSSPQPAATVAQRTSALRQRLTDAVDHAEAAVFNAAQSYQLAGQRELAWRYAGQAAQFSRYAERARILLAKIGAVR